MCSCTCAFQACTSCPASASSASGSSSGRPSDSTDAWRSSEKGAEARTARGVPARLDGRDEIFTGATVRELESCERLYGNDMSTSAASTRCSKKSMYTGRFDASERRARRLFRAERIRGMVADGEREGSKGTWSRGAGALSGAGTSSSSAGTSSTSTSGRSGRSPSYGGASSSSSGSFCGELRRAMRSCKLTERSCALGVPWTERVPTLGVARVGVALGVPRADAAFGVARTGVALGVVSFGVTRKGVGFGVVSFGEVRNGVARVGVALGVVSFGAVLCVASSLFCKERIGVASLAAFISPRGVPCPFFGIARLGSIRRGVPGPPRATSSLSRPRTMAIRSASPCAACMVILARLGSLSRSGSSVELAGDGGRGTICDSCAGARRCGLKGVRFCTWPIATSRANEVPSSSSSTGMGRTSCDTYRACDGVCDADRA